MIFENWLLLDVVESAGPRKSDLNIPFNFPFFLSLLVDVCSMTVVADVLLEEYNAFVAQIQAASDDGDLEKLGQQRQNMADKFPLTPSK